MAWGFGLGRERTDAGRFLDRYRITQTEIQKESGLSESTLTRICSDRSYNPSKLTRRTFVNALQRMGYDVEEYDFW
jgi:transcriptional regulator with XRE-family HTH domain